MHRATGGSAGITTTHIDDVHGCRDPRVFGPVRRFLERRLGPLKLQKRNFTNVGVELPQAKKFTGELQPAPTSPALQASRQRISSAEASRRCQRTFGALCRIATISRPGICPRLAQWVAKVNCLRLFDFQGANELITTVKNWLQCAAVKYNSGLRLETLSLAGRPDAAHGDQTKEGRRRWGYPVDLLPSPRSGPVPHLLKSRWPLRRRRALFFFAKENNEEGGWSRTRQKRHPYSDFSPLFSHTTYA